MTFDDLPSRSSVFLDANPLVYFFASDPLFGPACARLLTRIEQQEIAAFTSTHVLSETVHHLMTLEAAAQFGWKSKIVQRLKRQPSHVQQLAKFRLAMEQIPQLGIQVLTITSPLLITGAAVSQQTGLLTNDALLVAVMQANGLTNLASHDSDFDRVAGIRRYGPA